MCAFRQNRFDLRNSNVNNRNFDDLSSDHVPDVILVYRPRQLVNDDGTGSVHPSMKHRAKRRPRHWTSNDLISVDQSLLEEDDDDDSVDGLEEFDLSSGEFIDDHFDDDQSELFYLFLE